MASGRKQVSQRAEIAKAKKELKIIQLFNSGKSVPEIAKEIEQAVTTVQVTIRAYNGWLRDDTSEAAGEHRESMFFTMEADLAKVRVRFYRALESLDSLPDVALALAELPGLKVISEEYRKLLELKGDFLGLTPDALNAETTRHLGPTGVRSVPELIARLEATPALLRAFLKGGLLEFLQQARKKEGKMIEVETV